MLRLLPQLTPPALLITGGQDPLTAPEQRTAFRSASPQHQVLEFAQAGTSSTRRIPCSTQIP